MNLETDGADVNETIQEENNNISLIKGDPKKAIRKLAWPMMITMFLTMTYNLADGIWVAGLGTEALAALGFATPLFLIVVGVGAGLGAGANSLIARYIGANDKKNADNTAIHSIIVSILISVIMTIVLTVFLKDILVIMGAGDSIGLAMEYGYIVFGGLIVFLFSNVGASILRAEGDVNRAMYAMAVTAILNIVIDPIFIYTLDMGMAGAAWATILSALVSCIIIAYWLFVQKSTYLSFARKDFSYDTQTFKDILNVGLPASADLLMISVLSIVLNYLLAIVSGNYGVAVYAAGSRIFSMALIPHEGLATAMLTVVGVAYGSKNYKNMNIGFNYSIKLGIIFSIIMSIILFIFADQISLIFAYSDSALIPGISLFIRIITLYVMSIPIGLIPTATFQGLGKGLNSLITILLRSAIFIILIGYILTITLGIGEIGVWWALSIGGLIGAVIAYMWVKKFLNTLTKVNS